MKVRVKKGYTAFYKLQFRKPNEVVEISEKVCPPWGIIIDGGEEVAPADEKEVAPADEKEVAPADEKEVAPADEKEVAPADEKEVAPADEEVPYTDEDIDELSALLDKAVELNIACEMTDKSIKEQIETLKKLIKEHKA